MLERRRKMPRMIFVEPKPPNLHIFSQFALPRLGSFILASMMKQRGWDVDIFVEEVRPIDYGALGAADLVGISTITATAPRAYAIAKRVRDGGTPVIMGGPHVTFLPDEALDTADFVIRGEGEEALMVFIDAWEADRDWSAVPGLSFQKDGRIVHNPVAPRVADLDTIPYPDHPLLEGNIPVVAGQRIIPVQTSRGCPFDCSFCSVTGMFGKKIRYRSTENIIEELKRYDHPKNFIFFYDDNFTANRERAKELLESMIRERFQFNWSTQVRVDVARDLELVRLMKKSGCRTLFIGLESVNPESLKAMKKRQTVEEIRRAVRILKHHHIQIHGMFVYGFDNDDRKTVRETVRFAKRVRLNTTQFLILTPLPGSECYEKMCEQRRIVFHDWSLYDAHHVVFKPCLLSPADLQWAQIRSHQKFYSLKESVKKFLTFRWIDVGVAHYARGLNRLWKKRNRSFLKVVDLLKPGREATISVDYTKRVDLEDGTKAA